MNRVTTDRNDPGLREIESDGQQAKYLILSDEERARGFVRPVRTSYIHRACGGLTTMGTELAETYARDPGFYGGTFCARCRRHFGLLLPDGTRAFIWAETREWDGSGGIGVGD